MTVAPPASRPATTPPAMEAGVIPVTTATSEAKRPAGSSHTRVRTASSAMPR